MARVKKVAKKRVPRRRVYKNRGVKALARKVSRMSYMLQPEKKTYLQNSPSSANGSLALGQLVGTTSGGGFIALDVSCSPAQGAVGNARIGNEIKMTSAYYQFQFIQQSATTSPIKLKMYWFLIKGYPQSTPAGSAQIIFNPNPFTNYTLYDAHSTLDNNHLANFRLLRTKTITIGQDNYSGLKMTKTVNVGLKLKKPISVRFQADGNQTQTDGWIYLYIMADSGNCSSSVASTATNVAHTEVNTGLFVNYNFITYYTDS